MSERDQYQSIDVDGGAVGAIGGEEHHIVQEITIVQETSGSPPDLEALCRAYLDHIRRTYRHLGFKGIPQVERVAALLPLVGLCLMLRRPAVG